MRSFRKMRESAQLGADARKQEAALSRERERNEKPVPCSRGLMIVVDPKTPDEKRSLFFKNLMEIAGAVTCSINPRDGKFIDQFLIAVNKEPGQFVITTQPKFNPDDYIAREQLMLVGRTTQKKRLDETARDTFLLFCFHDKIADLELALLKTRIKIFALQNDITLFTVEELKFDGMEEGEEDLSVGPMNPLQRLKAEAEKLKAELKELKKQITILEATGDWVFIELNENTPAPIATKFKQLLAAKAGSITESINPDGSPTPRWFATETPLTLGLSCFNKGLAEKETALVQTYAQMLALQLGIQIKEMKFEKGPEKEPEGFTIVGKITIDGKPVIVEVMLAADSAIMSLMLNPKGFLATVRDLMIESIRAGHLDSQEIHFPNLKIDERADVTDVEVLSVKPGPKPPQQIFMKFQVADEPKLKA